MSSKPDHIVSAILLIIGATIYTTTLSTAYVVLMTWYITITPLFVFAAGLFMGCVILIMAIKDQGNLRFAMALLTALGVAFNFPMTLVALGTQFGEDVVLACLGAGGLL